MERVSLWSYISSKFEDSIRLIVVKDYDKTDRRIRSLSGTLSLLKILANVLLSKNRVYIMLYPISFPAGFPLTRSSFLKGVFFILALKLISMVKNGTVIIKVHDLPKFFDEDRILKDWSYQSKEMTKCFEKIIFRLVDEIWITSKSFRKILISDTGINPLKIKVVINGSPRFTDHVPKKADPEGRVKFVYAGNLSKVRGVEDMIRAFLLMENKNCKLILCGEYGDWIPNIYKNDRIQYYGLFSGEEIGPVVASCDVAIIPYLPGCYTNIMFPSKLALYITSETPILTTNITETARVVLESNIGLCCSLNHLSQYMDLIAENHELRSKFKENCRKTKENYFWDTIFDNAFKDVIRKYGLRIA